MENGNNDFPAGNTRRGRGATLSPPTNAAPATRPVRRWPLYLIAAPAAVAIWSGWVGLGELCGFGVVNLLPGIGSGLHLNTAITLPIGVEAYAALAIGAWMSPASPPDARRFAKRSAIGALAYGALGQVVYHLLAAAGATAAPWPVVVVVSCMPLTVVGFAAALIHKLRLPVAAAVSVRASVKPKLPTVREIQDRRGCGQQTAVKAREEVKLALRTLEAGGRDASVTAVPATLNGNRRE